MISVNISPFIIMFSSTSWTSKYYKFEEWISK